MSRLCALVERIVLAAIAWWTRDFECPCCGREKSCEHCIWWQANR